MAYLYGASIQGIQDFIFETNKLKEIIGASDLIERFCSIGFMGRFSKKYNFDIVDNNVLRNAGGNIRIIFENKTDLEYMVKFFPQYIMNMAYGITISQAVVEYDEGTYLEKVKHLEQKLKYDRNKASLPLDSKFAVMMQSPRTGKPAVAKKNKEYFDNASWQKRSNAEESKVNILLEKLNLEEIFEKFPQDMEEISNKNNKVAVIHADGNKMGLMLQQINKDLKDKSTKEIQDIFKEFSVQITEATNSAVEEAFKNSFSTDNDTIPFRPIVIGGDDVTVICSAEHALDFTEKYLRNFENNTEKLFAKANLSQYESKLTACAGIVYCNEKFPFHYAVDLAEKLCDFAKKESDRKASCLAFHNVQSSYFTDYKSYVSNELITKDNISLQYAPYYVDQYEDKPTIDALNKLFNVFNAEGVPTGKFRSWLSELHKNKEYAALNLERIEAVLESQVKKNIKDALEALNPTLKISTLIDGQNKTPMHDVLQLKSVLQGSK